MMLKVNAPLDPGFAPMVMEFRAFEEAAEKSGGKKIVIGIERNKGYISTYEMTVFEDGCGHDDDNFAMAERIVKTLLWARGGYKIIIAGSDVIGGKIKEAYDFGGLRDFDRGFMARVYERPFEVESVPLIRLRRIMRLPSPSDAISRAAASDSMQAEATARSAP